MLLFDRDGNPIDPLTFARLLDQAAYRCVARTTVTSGASPATTYDVSTVWLGVNYRFVENGPPIIFETMVFGDGSEDLGCARYCTEQQAREGHTAMVVSVAATLTDPIVIDVPTEHEPDCLHCHAFSDETATYTLDWGDEDSPPEREPTDVAKTLSDIDALPSTPSE